MTVESQTYLAETFSQMYPPVQASGGQDWYYIRSG